MDFIRQGSPHPTQANIRLEWATVAAHIGTTVWTVRSRGKPDAYQIGSATEQNEITLSDVLASPLYFSHVRRSRPAYPFAALLGIWFFPTAPATDRAEPYCRPRYLCGHAHRRRQVALLSASGASPGQNRSRDFSPDRTDARSGRPTGSNGNCCRGLK